jgi:hypothetical protein
VYKKTLCVHVEHSHLSGARSVADIRATVRKCWLYDFRDDPVRLWDGQGVFIDSEGHEWLGTIDANGGNMHSTPSLQDGRDGTSASYTFEITLPNAEDVDVLALYNGLKAEQAQVSGRTLTCYLALFLDGEGLRPGSPLSFYKQLVMQAPKFSESIARDNAGRVIKQYRCSVVARDSNSGRSMVPGRTYADTMQKRHAAELGVSVDRGAEYLALLANRTYQIP